MVFASILIPTYQRFQLLSCALTACIEQGAEVSEPIEIVVIDNCFDGSARSIAAELSRTSPVDLRYVHEPRKGVATVRNSALRAARGKYVIFLDDDQLPQPGWLRAYIGAAKNGAKAAFGPLDPHYEKAPTVHVDAVRKMFSRKFSVEDGGDIGSLYPYLGTGNSLFEKHYCFPESDPFDACFDSFGGEDVWMLAGLHARGIPFTWAAGAYVLEFVPASRMSHEYLCNRRYHSGQIRTMLSLHPTRKRPAAGLLWMVAGGAQMAINLTLCWLTWFFARERALDYRIKSFAGMGKIFWFWKNPVQSRRGRRQ
jgi:succinoglycan biosynthesis protein ExoM